jgi:apolipoprotein N-acyltransferase
MEINVFKCFVRKVGSLNKQKARVFPRFFAHGMTFFVTFLFWCYQNFHHGFFSTAFLSFALLLLVVALEVAPASALVTLSFQVPF